uniref:Uncharacterized protein n=1 Tax=Anguilla anguilla TaxID=7936 RepID=A0A0E9TUD3_ANGAN
MLACVTLLRAFARISCQRGNSAFAAMYTQVPLTHTTLSYENINEGKYGPVGHLTIFCVIYISQVK